MVNQPTELENTELENADRSLFPSNYTIMALRDSRYNNTAYAIAELIDNSIEADAPQIELLCTEKTQTVRSQIRNQIFEIAVLDNGTGMEVRTLLDALKFGGGTRHNSNRGIGKYGMGLPTSSMSQCKRVDVWTWQEGLDSAWHSYIDADEIEHGNHQVPLPDQGPIPEKWKETGSDEIYEHRSGTLVVWSKLDKIHWKTARAIIDNTAREVGRIHRHYIERGIYTIRAASFLESQPNNMTYEKIFVPNDPLYLMNHTSTPDPWDSEPMFKQWCEPICYTSTVNGQEVTIEVRYSIVKPEALRTDSIGHLPGNEPHGKHAGQNIGVSVLREDREIVLEGAFLREGGSADNPMNRWWGCEVHFSRACDELFGVDHNKQMVANFTQAAKTLARDDRPNQLILDEIGIDEDLIYKIVGDIRNQTRAMMREISRMFAQRRPQSKQKGGRETPENTAVRTATDADKEAIKTGVEPPTQTDLDRERIPPEERETELTQQFIESGQTEQDAQQRAQMLVRESLAYQFNSTQLDGFQMFNVRSHQGILHINLNIDHPLYDLLKHFEDQLNESDDDDTSVFQAIVAIRLLLLSWARMEDQTESQSDRTRTQDIAMNWGRQADKVMDQLRERDG